MKKTPQEYLQQAEAIVNDEIHIAMEAAPHKRTSAQRVMAGCYFKKDVIKGWDAEKALELQAADYEKEIKEFAEWLEEISSVLNEDWLTKSYPELLAQFREKGEGG